MTQGNGQRCLFLFDQRKKLAGGQTNHPMGAVVKSGRKPYTETKTPATFSDQNNAPNRQQPF
jgi:hypothetical protein